MRLKNIFSRKEETKIVQEPSAFLVNSRSSISFHHASATPSASAGESDTAASPEAGPSERQNASTGCWALAASELQLDNPTVAKTLIEIQRQSSSDHHEIIDSLVSGIEVRRSEFEQKRWRLQLAGKGIILREQLSKISKAVQNFKGLGDTLTGLDPIHAGLPWAGICFVMQLTLSDTD